MAEWLQKAWQLGLSQAMAQLTEPYWESRLVWPHPPLFRFLALLSRTLLPGMGFPTAERFPTMLTFAFGCTAIFLALRRRGWAAGLVGAAALATMPRFLAYSGFCTPDMPEAVAWIAITLCYERYESTRRRAWLLATAGLFCFAMGSKISALTLIPALGCVMLALRFKKGWRDLLNGGINLALVLAAGLAAMVLVYPYLWPAPFSRMGTLLSVARTWSQFLPFSVLFFGQVKHYTELPWYFVPTMLGLVTPPLTLGLALLGLFWARTRDALWMSGAVVFAFWCALLLLPNTPKYDNDRQLLALFPFLALFAGMAAQDGIDRLSARVSERMRRWLKPGLAPLLIVAMAVEWWGAQPDPLSYYTPVVGGLVGAARLGFDVTYGLEVLSPSVLASFEQRLPEGATMTLLPAPDFADFLQQRGYIRRDIRIAHSGGPYFLFVNRHGATPERAQARMHGQRLSAYRHDRVPLAELWYLPTQRPAETAPAPADLGQLPF